MDGVLIEKERRRDGRFDFSGRLFYQITVPTNQWLPPNEGILQRGERPSAVIKNVGERGCCLLLDWPLEKFQIIKIDFPLPQTSLTIPTLAEVRWALIEPELNQYTVGVRYLL